MRKSVKYLCVAAALGFLSLLFDGLAKRSGFVDRLVPCALMVLFGGYLMPMNWAVACAVIYPILSTICFETMGPTLGLPLFVCEMIALAAFANFFYSMLDVNPYVVFLLANAGSLVVLFCAASIYGAVSDGTVDSIAYLATTIQRTWPGLLLQAVVVPASVYLIRIISKGRLGMPGLEEA